MRDLIKPRHLEPGDLVATVSPCWGLAGDPKVRWKYDLGVSRLQELGLRVVAAPNSMKGADYLAEHPEARAQDILWAFENREVRAIIANIGGNDSIKLLPYIDPKVIEENPKIFVGYSDVMNLHLLCYHCGLSSFYGDNLLTTIADAAGWHTYSKASFIKTLMEPSPIGPIEPSADWTYEPSDHFDPEKKRSYYPNDGYRFIQGCGHVTGRLIGGHTGIMDLAGTPIEFAPEDLDGAILFVEDIPEFFDEAMIRTFFGYLGQTGILNRIHGILIGKVNEASPFDDRARIIREIVSGTYSCTIPIVYGLNFGHSSPTCLLPYGALTQIDCDAKTISVLESGVL